ncbi:MAG: MFS transporter [Chloroflexi bacterium]|nr:MFS transporter [Chloroflexota bacterium]
MRVRGTITANWKWNLAAAWVAQFLCIVGFNAAFPFMPFYIRDLGVSDPDQVKLWTGMIASAGPISMALVSPIWGVLADRRGRKLMVERATFGGAVILALMAFAGNVQQLFLLRLIQGTLTGTIPAFITLVASFAPASEAGFALGMMQMAVFSGASVGPLIGGLVADRFGYRWAFMVTGAVLLIAGFLVYLFVREGYTPPKERPANSGLVAGARTVLHSAPVLAAVVALGGVYMANQASRPLLPLLVEMLQPDPTTVNTVVGFTYGANAVAGAISAAVIGRISDKVGHRAMLAVCALAAALAYVGQALAPSASALIGIAFATGLFAGGLTPVANAILAGTVPREQQGAVYGLSTSVNAAGRALGPMIGAAVATSLGLRASFATTGGLLALVAVWVIAASTKGQNSAAPSGKTEG